MQKNILVSSCLLGLCVNFRGKSHPHPDLVRLAREGRVLCFCPEQGGGLPCPRTPAEIEPGKTAADVLDGTARVLDKNGDDVTEQYPRGARLMTQLAELTHPDLIVLREGSPSCGVNVVHDGNFRGDKIPGCGVTACALKRAGFTIVSDTEFSDPE